MQEMNARKCKGVYRGKLVQYAWRPIQILSTITALLQRSWGFFVCPGQEQDNNWYCLSSLPLFQLAVVKTSQQLGPYSIILGAALQYGSEELKVFKRIIGAPMTKKSLNSKWINITFQKCFLTLSTLQASSKTANPIISLLLPCC